MDEQVNEQLADESFRRVNLDVDAASGDGGDPKGTSDSKDAEDDGCTVWEYKLHRQDIIDGPSSTIKFSSRSDLLHFIDAHRNNTGNPFNSDQQTISFCPDRASEQENFSIFVGVAQELVQDYGKYIVEMEVNLLGLGSPLTVLCFLTTLIKWSPNLKTLHLNLDLGPKEKGAELNQHVNNYVRVELEERTCNVELEYLNLRLYKSRHVVMLAPILEVIGPKLKKISVTPYTWNRLTTKQQKKFENLEEFNLCWTSLQRLKVGKNDMYAPFPEGFAPKLEKLRLMYSGYGKLERPLEWLFYLVQKFPQLKLLNLTGFHLMPNDKVRVRDLPSGNASLKSLKFQDHPKMNYDFLMRLTGLKNLFIEGNRFVRSDESEEDTFAVEEGEIKLRCFLYREQLSRSNVWEKVPSLERVVLQRYPVLLKEDSPEVTKYLRPQ